MAKRIDETAARRVGPGRPAVASRPERLDDAGLEAVRIAADETQREAMEAWRRGLARDPRQERG